MILPLLMSILRLIQALWGHPDVQELAECQEAIFYVQGAAPVGTSVECVPRGGYEVTASGFDGNQYAGVYFSVEDVATIHAYHPNNSPSYYREVAAHEIGHAVAMRLTPLERLGVIEAMGWEAWDGEQFADLYALQLGFWSDYGDGWRHPTLANQYTRGGAPPELPYDLYVWFQEWRMP